MWSKAVLALGDCALRQDKHLADFSPRVSTPERAGSEAGSRLAGWQAGDGTTDDNASSEVLATEYFRTTYGAGMYLSYACTVYGEEGCFQTSSRNGTPAQETKLLPEADKTRRVTGCTRGSQEQQALQPPFEFGMLGWAGWRAFKGPYVPQVWAQGSVIACMELGRVGDRRASRPASQSL